jgi:hypothetical protein
MRHRVALLVVAFLLTAGGTALAQNDASPTDSLTVSQYITELDRLASSSKGLSKPEEVPDLLNSIPPVWRVQSGQDVFEVRSDWLRELLNDWQRDPDHDTLDEISERLITLRSEAASFQNPSTDDPSQRMLLDRILAGQEFGDVHGETWLDRLKQRALLFLFSLLERAFGSSAIPTIGKVIVYGLVALTVAGLGYWMYRTIQNNAGVEAVAIGVLPVSSKGWKIWLAEARRAAESGQWRDAIHLAYWCGISFLEGEEMWRPDTARTPREYLRLLPPASHHRETLRSLTRTFELVWYGNEQADASMFSETLAQLEELGCQSN